MANYFGFPAKSWEENAEAFKYLLFVEPLITEELFNDDDVDFFLIMNYGNWGGFFMMMIILCSP